MSGGTVVPFPSAGEPDEAGGGGPPLSEDLGPVIEKQAAGRSDHAPFERRKIPFLFFSTSEHDDYHQPTDTIATLDRKALWRTTACIYRTVLAIDARDERPTFVAKPAAKGDEATTEKAPAGK